MKGYRYGWPKLWMLPDGLSDEGWLPEIVRCLDGWTDGRIWRAKLIDDRLVDCMDGMQDEGMG